MLHISCSWCEDIGRWGLWSRWRAYHLYLPSICPVGTQCSPCLRPLRVIQRKWWIFQADLGNIRPDSWYKLTWRLPLHQNPLATMVMLKYDRCVCTNSECTHLLCFHQLLGRCCRTEVPRLKTALFSFREQCSPTLKAISNVWLYLIDNCSIRCRLLWKAFDIDTVPFTTITENMKFWLYLIDKCWQLIPF